MEEEKMSIACGAMIKFVLRNKKDAFKQMKMNQ